MDFRYILLSFSGRLNRQPYWLFAIGVSILNGIITGIAQSANAPLLGLIGLVFLWPALALAIKRIHDRGRSGWFLLLFLVPFVNFWVLIELLFLRGTVGPNTYGPDPLGAPAIGYTA